MEDEATVNDDPVTILLLENHPDDEETALRNRDPRLCVWEAIKPMVDDEATTCVREIARRWLAARRGETLERPAFDVRSTDRVGHA